MKHENIFLEFYNEGSVFQSSNKKCYSSKVFYYQSCDIGEVDATLV